MPEIIKFLISESLWGFMFHIYSKGTTPAFIIFLCGGLYFTIRRIKKMHNEYVETGTVDDFDDSIIFNPGTKHGTNPFGILIDTIVYFIFAFLLSFFWPLSVPFGIIMFSMYMKRKKVVFLVRYIYGQRNKSKIYR